MKSWGKLVLSGLVLTSVMFQPSYSNAEDLTNASLYPYYKKVIEQKKNLSFSPLEDLLEDEPNNSISEANSINYDDLVTGTLKKDDIDFYKINLQTADKLVVLSTGYAPINIDFSLYNQNGDLVEPVESGSYKDSDVTGAYGAFDLEAGTYYISATDLDNNGSDSSYELISFSEGDFEEEIYVERIAGEDRYETAVQISNYMFPEGSKNVVLARDNQFPDALSGAPLAQKLNAPILLTKKDGLPELVKEEIARLGAKKITILGGINAISPLVESTLKEMGVTIERIGGSDRYETSAMIASKLGPANTAIVAYGENYPDALSVAPFAAINGYPILLTKKDVLPSKIADVADQYSQKYVIGGKQAVSDLVMEKLGHVQRIAGKDRYETSVKIATEFRMPGETIVIATGEQFTDALAGSVLAANNFMPVLLVKPNDLTDGVRQFIDDHNTFLFTILGGTDAVSEEVENELQSVTHETELEEE